MPHLKTCGKFEMIKPGEANKKNFEMKKLEKMRH